MIELSRHVEILLLSNDCVIVPNFGGFLTHYVCARYDDGDNHMLPPLRTLGFNPQLKLNDHLLVQSYVEAYDISYPEALRRIENEVEELKQHLENEGMCELTDLGVLRTNDDGNYEFVPCEAGILTPTLYGLSSVEVLPLSEQQKTVQKAFPQENVKRQNEEQVARNIPIENVENDSNSAIVIRMSWMRNMIATAVAILLLLLFVSPHDNNDFPSHLQESSFLTVPVKEQAPASMVAPAKSVQANPVQTQPKQDPIADRVDAKTAEPVQKTIQKRKSSSYYTIVLASQTLKHHAQRFINQLDEYGIHGVTMAPMTEMPSKVRVVYGSFETSDEAHSELQRLRATTDKFNEAWIFHAKE